MKKEHVNLLRRLAVCPVTREQFTQFHFWSVPEPQFRTSKGMATRRENFAAEMLRLGYLSWGQEDSVLRVTSKGSSCIHRESAKEMLHKYHAESGSSAGLLSFAC